MKKITFISLILLIAFSAIGQDISGLWYSQTNVKTAHLRFTLDIRYLDTKENIAIKLQSVDQSKEWFPVDNYKYSNNQLSFTVDRLNLMTYCTIESDSIIKGTLIMEGGEFPIKFSRTPIIYNRPQTPKPPFPYITKEVKFKNNEDKITLAGTLTLPNNKKPARAVILLTGSGPQNRDSELFEHKPFAVIADYLARNGVATLRFDERGVGESEGDFSKASIPEFASDTEAAIQFLKTIPEIDSLHIGVAGHSEGAAVAFTVAANDLVNFIITLGGGGVNGEKLLLMQRKALLTESGADSTYIKNYIDYMRKAQQIALQTANVETCQAKLSELFSGTPLAGSAQSIAHQLHNTTMLGMLKYNPEWDYPDIKVPVLALNGDKDCQVPVENLKHIEKGLLKAGNKNVTIKSFDNLNHFFQTAETGLPYEYAIIEESFNTEVLKVIVKWIKGL